MSERLVLLALAWLNVAAADPESRADAIGQPISEREAASTGVSVLPSGAGLPEGRGRAKEGEIVYRSKCAACHGDNGEGRGDFPALVGGRGSLSSDKPVLTVGSYWPLATSAFDYIWRAMPYQEAGSLTPDEVYAVTAWILSANDIIGTEKWMDRVSLPQVHMPNRDGFIPDPRPDASPSRGADRQSTR